LAQFFAIARVQVAQAGLKKVVAGQGLADCQNSGGAGTTSGE
jgi:hypothetical protein